MLTASQREQIRAARDAAKRATWDAHSRRAATLDPDALIEALDFEEWRSTSEVAETLGVRSAEARVLGRALLLLPSALVEHRDARGQTPRRFRRKLPPAG